MRGMFTQPETWVAIAFVILFVLFAYLGIHKTVLTALDHRAERIRAELDDAAAANAAVEAASTILSQSVKGSVADDLLAKGIAEVSGKLN